MVQGVGFDGLATGMDTDEIIQELMEIERESIVRQQQDIEEIEEEQEVWQEVNQHVVDLDNTVDSLDNEDIYQDREAISGDEDVMTVDAEPGAQPAVYRDMRVDQLAEAHSVRADEAIAEIDDLDVEETTDALGLEGEFRISLPEGEEDESVDIEVEEEDSLADIRDSINQSEGPANSRIVRGHMIIEAEETGEENQIELEDIEDNEDDNILQTLTILDEDGEMPDLEAERVNSPENAVFQIEGMEEESPTNTGVEITDDVTVDLEGVSGEDETFDIEIREDTEEFEEGINEFIESFNEVQSFLNEMTDEDEMLQGDVTARRLQSSLRTAVMDTAQELGEELGNEEIFSLGDMGIEIDADAQEAADFEGQMSIADDGDFDEALSLHMDEVQNLFMGDEEAGVDGVVDRMSEQIGTYLGEGVMDDGLIGDREESLENEIGRISDSIAQEERRMENREERMREQFTQMEMAVYEAQQQQQEVAQMSQQLGATSLSDMMM